MSKPAVSFAAVPGRRRRTIELATEVERRGFTGLFCPSFGDGVALSQEIARATREVSFGTSIANIYTRHPHDYAQTAAFIHELSNGRFRFGIGVSHVAANDRLGIKTGKPLADMRRFVTELRQGSKRTGPLPPIILATLRRKMVQLAVEIADGAVWANAACSHMPQSLAVIPVDKRHNGFFIGNMVPTCIADDRTAAAAIMRRVLLGYVQLPHYRNYWIEAGYEEEMRAIEAAIAAQQHDQLPELMTDRWLSDVTLFGTATHVRDGVERWRAAGVTTPILVPSSTRGGQLEAFEELFSAFA